MSLKFNQSLLEEVCTSNGIEFLGVFGSVARNSDKPQSDIDLLVRFSPSSKVSYFKLFDIESKLKAVFGTSKRLDLVTQDSLHSQLKARVYSDMQTIYGQP